MKFSMRMLITVETGLLEENMPETVRVSLPEEELSGENEQVTTAPESSFLQTKEASWTELKGETAPWEAVSHLGRVILMRELG